MSANQIAFFIGLFGSIHCVGMCGPLAFAIPVSTERWWLVLADKIIYNLGRIISYVFLGLLIGLVGKQLWVLGLQQIIGFISGLLIIIAGLSRMLKLTIGSSRVSSFFFAPVNRLLSHALQHKAGHLIIGMLNGLLPCGFVYLALAGAINTASSIGAAQYMLWFGTGTFPLMLAATIGSGYIGPVFRRRINKAIPYFMVLLGFWFILRSAGINIPYLSAPLTHLTNACG
ncbi:hypothetical protein BEL04_06270 [Mucilaginibacter sp. PPCGB 2223]|uniref:sulfite exporter TauE/SafE family protein n=1 Tax=Mucilaginibacter sp. PPCGB 2223 TaxID=1886027 RepID=UPI0008250FB7|nr:sulfite exporter TauE/SafE family protein [Mucilaginibacter sp. PPCGB 2223]OCX53888.1 hypothetical protein BEL04_06270 [Mucilaginibacter sp. PPCGB 2223]